MLRAQKVHCCKAVVHRVRLLVPAEQRLSAPHRPAANCAFPWAAPTLSPSTEPPSPPLLSLGDPAGMHTNGSRRG